MELETKPTSSTNEDRISPTTVKSVITKYFNTDQFDDYIFEYMANMILEDNPDNAYDLVNIIGDYFTDQIRYNDDEILVICKEILINLISLGFKSERKAIIAQRLTNQ